MAHRSTVSQNGSNFSSTHTPYGTWCRAVAGKPAARHIILTRLELGRYSSVGKEEKIPEKYQQWIEAGKRYHLSHAHIQMAREPGLNPKKFGSLANTKLEPRKLPMPEYIEELYIKHFKKNRPDNVRAFEQMVNTYHFFCLRAEAAARAEWLTPYAEAVPPDAAGPAGCPISTASALESRTRPNFKAKFFRVAECIPGS